MVVLFTCILIASQYMLLLPDVAERDRYRL
jgi:hypothetical protein